MSGRLTTNPEEPRHLDRYTVLGTLGKGGMSVVYEAVDHELDRRIALKVLQDELEQRHTTRLIREAQALAKLSHPNVVQVYGVGEAEERSFIAMELVEGQTLRTWLRQEPPPGWRECVEVFIQAAEGLSAAHQRGLVHRDFKPNNAVIDAQGRVKVLDFGLVRELGDADESPSPVPAGEASPDDHRAEHAVLTRPGAVMGTPAYMAPEQCRGEPADARSDQFGFCVSLYEAVYGERPTSVLELGLTTIPGDRSSHRHADVPARLQEILRRGLSESPEQRWPTMDVLLTELRRLMAPEPKRRWLPLGVTGGLGALGVLLALKLGGASPCTGAAAHLEGIWDQPRRRGLQSAILNTELSFAPDTWGRVERRIDAYTDAWTDKHVEVCEATNVEREQSAEVMDLRMECLRHARVALRETIDVLSQTESPVRRAVSVLERLPPVSSCDRVDALRSKLVPATPELAEDVARQRERLQEADVLFNAGIYDDANDIAAEVLARAQTLGYRPLIAEAVFYRGIAGFLGGRLTEAEHDLLEANTMAAELGHEFIEVNSAAKLIPLLGDRLARHEEALWWGRAALARAKSERFSRQQESSVETSIGTVLLRMGRLEEALEHCLRSTEVLSGDAESSGIRMADSLNNTANVLYSLNRVDEALELYQRGYEISRQHLGPRHPEIANSLLNIGNVFRRRHALDEARDHYRQALEIRIEVLGPEHSEVAMVLDNSANLLLDQSKFEEAIETLERSAAIKRKSLGPEHPSLALTLNNLANALSGLGRHDEAVEFYRRSLSIRERALGPNHIDVGHSLRNLAPLLAWQGELDEALEMQQRAIEIYLEVLGPSHPEMAGAYGQAGAVHQTRGEYDAALSSYQRGLDLVDRVMGGDPPRRALFLRSVGSLWSEQEEFVKALESFREALTLREGAFGPDDFAIAESHADIGRTLRAMGEVDDGRAELQRALELMQRTLSTDDPRIAVVLVDLASIAIERREFADARASAESALSIVLTSDSPSEQRARARFVLARSLWPDPAQRSRARGLAELAAADYTGSRGDFESDRLEVERWLETHASR